MKRITLSQLPLQANPGSSSSSSGNTPNISVRSSFGPRRGAAMQPVCARASRCMRNFLKRGRASVLRTALLTFVALIAAACASGRLGLIVTSDTLTLRLARAPPHRASHIVRTVLHNGDHPVHADAAPNENDNDADADDLGNEGHLRQGTTQMAHSQAKDVERPIENIGAVHHGESRSSMHTRKSATDRHTRHAASTGHIQDTSNTRHTLDAVTSPVITAPPFSSPRKLSTGKSRDLTVPIECAEWRSLAHDATRLRLYRLHFTSLDFTDWFVFVSMFTEAWHRQRRGSQRPVYIDVAANHARRWSNTYFMDRCMGWDGVCAEANAVYHDELRRERHCALIDTCVSDRPRAVNFSFAAAYGGVVRGGAENKDWGVDGGLHATRAKYAAHFRGFKTLTCTTLSRELPRLGISHVDFMSLDVEGYELPVLMGINWPRTTVDVLVVENKRKEVVSFLAARGFDRYRGVLKDDIYIRRGSGYAVDPKFAGWLQTITKSDHRFHISGSASS